MVKNSKKAMKKCKALSVVGSWLLMHVITLTVLYSDNKVCVRFCAAV